MPEQDPRAAPAPVPAGSPTPRQLPSLSSEYCLSQRPSGSGLSCAEGGRRLKATSCRAVMGKDFREAVTAGSEARHSRGRT